VEFIAHDHNLFIIHDYLARQNALAGGLRYLRSQETMNLGQKSRPGTVIQQKNVDSDNCHYIGFCPQVKKLRRIRLS
jgi:hypothetical protein